MNELITPEICRKNQIKLAFDTLAAAGIEKVTVTFDGCGDSGQLEDTAVEPEGKALSTESCLYWTSVHDHWLSEKPPQFKPGSGSINDLLEEIVYDQMGIHHPGWENNDGAYGQFEFVVAERKIEYEHNTRYTDSSQDAYTITE